MITKRSQQKELIDLGPEFYSQDEYQDCLQKLFRVSQFFGFFRSTLKVLKTFSQEVTLLDIGCGGGLFLLNLSKHFPHMRMLGIDINPDAVTQAQETLGNWQKQHLAALVSFNLQPRPELPSMNNRHDIVLATLVCHHLQDQELIVFLQQAYSHAKQAVIINDLQRHRLSEWLYAIFSPILFSNRLISHDGLISIQRGFTRAEWKLLLQKANLQQYQIKWCFPFRWQIILRK
jgi:2-polyprenyl-3-methyl-5-hydroxy-6-metoxy-1,4-benzoquinol methylase